MVITVNDVVTGNAKLFQRIEELEARNAELLEKAEMLDWMLANTAWLCPPIPREGPYRVYNDYDRRLSGPHYDPYDAIREAMERMK